MGCVNVPLNLLLIVGACWRKGCPLMPWIVITLLEHLIVGIPLIVFIGLISLYLAAQLQLYICAAILIVFIITLFFLSLSSWVCSINWMCFDWLPYNCKQNCCSISLTFFPFCFSSPCTHATTCSMMTDIEWVKMGHTITAQIANPLNRLWTQSNSRLHCPMGIRILTATTTREEVMERVPMFPIRISTHLLHHLLEGCTQHWMHNCIIRNRMMHMKLCAIRKNIFSKFWISKQKCKTK